MLKNLVAYDSSESESESELEELIVNKSEGSATGKPEVKKGKKIVINFEDNDTSDDKNTPNLEFMKKNLRLSSTASGLFNRLPPPKSNGDTKSKTSLIPNVLKRKNVSDLLEDLDDEEDSNRKSNKFFNINNSKIPQTKSIPKIPKIEAITDLEESNNDKLESGSSLSRGNSYFANLINEKAESIHEQEALTEHDETRADKKVNFDRNDIVKLCGRKSQIGQSDFKIIDVNTDEIARENKLLLLKGLTDDSNNLTMVNDKKFESDLSSQHRKKHQITYLAQKAVENEQALSNFWAQGRMAKDQGRRKYGF